ncbi:MAG: aminotransferase class V-fold PLP-dependent enzyme [Alcanivoracaceae bacterium]|nr:aminotransferase class V-fold PLP-dependent enzyme [Alcanivoracaceae bacterium]
MNAELASLVDHEFPLDPYTLYLNHAAVAPWPQRTADAVGHFARENTVTGARHYPRWMQTENRLRQQAAELIGAHRPEDVALLKNTSEGLSFIAAGLDWQPGDEVLTSNEEFPSNRIPWQALSARDVRLKEVSLQCADPEQALIDAIGPRTRLLTISSVQYGTGLRLDLERLGRACREQNVLFCVDAIQSVGAVPMDVQACHADMLVADGHKWMLGPEGLALFWVNPAIREQLALTEFGWHMIADAGDYDTREWAPAADARRFECGSPNMLCAHALSASLSLLLEVGMNTVWEQLQHNVTYLLAQLEQRPGVEILSPRAPDRRAGIVTFRVDGHDNEALYRQLQAAGVVCAKRGGGIRLSPHFYTPESVMDQALKAF